MTAKNTTMPTSGTFTPSRVNHVSIPDELKCAIDLFTRQSDKAETTLKVYQRTLLLFFVWVIETGRQTSTLTVADVKEWKNELLQAGKSSLTVAGYLTALRAFYSWIDGNKLGEDITRGIRTPRRVQAFQKQHLTKEKAVELLHFYDSPRSTSTGRPMSEIHMKRDMAIVNLMLRCGLRCIEVARANIGDITFRNGHRIMMVHGKGRDCKDKFVMLTDKAFAPIAEYLDTRRGAGINEPLFVSESNRNGGGRLTTRTISGICKAGIKTLYGPRCPEYTAHSLRHTCAVMILTHGGRIEDCMEVLRHTNPSTTQIYLESIREDRRMARFAESKIDKAF